MHGDLGTQNEDLGAQNTLNYFVKLSYYVQKLSYHQIDMNFFPVFIHCKIETILVNYS